MKKSEFVKILYKVSEILENEGIKHDIPLPYINKEEFNYVTIIIPDHIAIYDISKMFNCADIKEKVGVINTIIDDIKIDFVKTSEKNWSYVFHYYSWNILHVLVDILFYENFHLKYEKNGLKYKYENKLINITNNLHDIFNFLELKFFMVYKGFPTLESIFMFIENSPYYDTKYFTMENFEIYDKNFKYNKQMYEKFIKHKPNTSIEKMSGEEQLVYIDVCFPNVKLLERIYKMEIKKEFPDLKEKEILIKPPQEIKEEVVKKFKRKKINLSKYKKDDPDFDFRIE